MIVDDSRSPLLRKIGGGAFSEVFDLGDGRVLKAFPDAELPVAPETDPRFIPTVAFAAECCAYQRLRVYADLAPYAPQFFGAVNPNNFLLDSTKSYSSGCGLVLELLRGKEDKIFNLPEPIRAKAEGVLEAMQEHVGIDDPWDGSGFVPGSRRPVTLIDFATPSERFAELDEIVSHHGTIPDRFEHALGITEAKKRWI